MPKRNSKVSKTQHLKAEWQYQDEVELLAWLDYTLKYGISFANTAVAHLKRAGTREFTYPQIERKLGYLWSYYGSDDSENKKDIYTRGSSCIGRLEADDEIAAALTRLESESFQLPSRRYLRSADSQRSERHISLETVEPLTPRRKRQQKPDPPTAQKRKCEYSEGELADIESIEGTREDTPKPVRQPSGEKTRKLYHSQTNKQNGPNIYVVRDSEENSSSDSDGGEWVNQDMKGSEVQPKSNLMTALSGGEPSYGIPANAEIGHKEKYRALKKATDAKIKDLELQVSNLHDHIRGLRSAQTQLQDTQGGSIQDVILQKDQWIGNLTRELNKRDELGTFTKSSGTHFTTRTVKSIREKMLEIGHQVKLILHAYDDEHPLNVPNVEKHRDFVKFVYQGLTLPEELMGPEHLTLRLAEVSPSSVIRALTEWCLREWVFESYFPNFAEEVRPFSLFAKYREHLATQDGAIVLRNIDLASHNSLIKDPNFREHVIHKKAKKLANRLSEALAPFFPCGVNEFGRKIFATWGQDESLWEERRSRLVEIFELALKLKADSLLNTEDYAVVLYPPGSAFDSDTMEVETMEGARADPPRDGKGIVDLCVHASLQAYTRQGLVDLDEPSKALVRYDNFIRKPCGQKNGAIVITKAVVILKDDEQSGIKHDTAL